MQTHRHARILVATLALGACAAVAQVDPVRLASAPIDQLQQAYLACDRAASQQVLDFGTAADCSMVSEALQRRAFDGSFERLLAWWRAAKDAVAGQVVTQTSK